MSEKLGTAVLELTTDDRGLDKGIGRAQSKSEKLADSFERQGQRARQIGGKLSVAVTAPIIAMAATSVNAHREQQKAIAGVEAALESMGNGAGFTSQQLQDMAANLQANSLFGDEEILHGVTANLLTFGNIADEQFTRAQQVALDLSARLDQDLKSSTVMLGKALNDPITGLTAMTRVGITFSEQQKEQIKTMAEAGDVAGAQALMLAELEKQYGGQAAAAAAADGGVIQLKNTWGDVSEEWGAVVAELLPALTSGLQGFANWLRSLDDDTKRWVIGIGLAAAAIGPLLMGVGFMATGIGALIGPVGSLIRLFTLLAPVIGAVGKAALLLAANPVFLAIAAAVAAVYLAWQNWDKIQPIIDAVGAAISGWWNETVQPVLDDVGEAITRVVDIFKAMFGEQISAVIDGLTALINGDFKGVWDAAERFATAPIRMVIKVLDSLAPNATAAVRSLYVGVKSWLQEKLGAVFDWFKGKIEAVEGAFAWLYDRVVGNSWIPDLVRDVGKSMAGLDDAMVKPALNAAETVDKAFAGIKPPTITPDIGDVSAPTVSGFAPGNGIPEDLLLDVNAQADDRIAQSRESIARTFSEGIRAAFKGDLGGFFDNWLDSLMNSLSDSLGNILAGLFSGEGSGGGLGGLLTSLFAGGFYTGGNIPMGQFGIVGERGPEPVFSTPRGALVRPNAALSSSAFRPAGAQVNIPITIDATGADAAALARVKGSVDALREELPGRIISTVQDAGERGIMNTPNWR